MVKRYGQEIVDDIIRKRNDTVKFTIADLKEMEEDYKKRTKELLEQLNNT